MRIVYLTPGSGGTFYCQNCLRDRALITELRRIGHEVIIVPMYLPLTDSEKEAPFFFGAIGFYLREKLPFFERIPDWLEKMLNSRLLLQWAARRAGSTRAKGTEKITLAMLRGENCHQTGEISKLIAWLKNEVRPDVAHLSNALIIGLAKPLKQELGIPVFCSLQDEDTWLNALAEPYPEMGWREMKTSAAYIDAFVAVSEYYGGLIQRKLKLPIAQIQVVNVGINLADYKPAPLSFAPPVIGYLSRLSAAGGLEILIEAFVKLKKDPRFTNLRLRAAGGMTDDDRPFLRRLKRILHQNQVSGDVEFITEFDSAGRYDFLQSLSILTVPVLNGEAFGVYQIEALASGVPVVQPKVGAFPEIVKATGGGLLFEPNQADKLAETLAILLANPSFARKLGQEGRDGVCHSFSIGKMAQNMVAIYQTFLNPGLPAREGVG